MSYIDQLAALYEAKGLPYKIHNGIFWQVYNRMVEPRGPASLAIHLEQAEAHDIRKALGGILIRWTSAFEDRVASPNDWYALVCDQHIPIEQYSKSQKKKLQKTLHQCEIKPIDASFIAKHAYPVYVKAHSRYDKNKDNYTDEATFKKGALVDVGFEDLIQYFGAFYQGQLIAYSKCYTFDDEEVNFTQSKYDPDYMKYRISEALTYVRTKHYLEEGRVRYINAGWRSIEHQTNVQDFYEQKFKFRKAPLALNIQYDSKINFAVNLLRPMYTLGLSFGAKPNALLKLDSFKNK